MISAFTRTEGADVGKRVPQSFSYSGDDGGVGVTRIPLLKNAVCTQVLPGDGIELFRVEQARRRGLNRRRRIQNDHVKIFRGAFEVEAPIVDYDLRPGRAQQ